MIQVPDSIKPLEPDPTRAAASTLGRLAIPDSIRPLAAAPNPLASFRNLIEAAREKIGEAIEAAPAIADKVRAMAPPPMAAAAAEPAEGLKPEIPDKETLARIAFVESGGRLPNKVGPPAIEAAKDVLRFAKGSAVATKEAGASALGGMFGGAASTAAILEAASEWMANQISRVTGIDKAKLKGGYFGYLSQNWGTISDKLKSAGVKTPVIKDIWEAVGQAAYDVPEIMATGGLMSHGVLKGFLSGLGQGGPVEAVKEATVGGITGGLTGKVLHGVAPLKNRIRLPAIFAFGAATSGPELKDRLVGGLTFAGLGIKGGGKETLRVSDYLEYFPKVKSRLEIGQAWNILRKIDPTLTKEEVNQAGGPKAVLQVFHDEFAARLRGEKPVEPEKAPAPQEKAPEKPKAKPATPAGKEGPAPAFMTPAGFNKFGEGRFRNVNRFLEQMAPFVEQGWVIRYDLPDKTGRDVYAKVVDKRSPGEGSLERGELDLTSFKIRREKMQKVSGKRKTPLTTTPLINEIRKMGGISLEVLEKAREKGEFQDLLERKDLPPGLFRKKGGKSPYEIMQALAGSASLKSGDVEGEWRGRFFRPEEVDDMVALADAVKAELEGRPRPLAGEEDQYYDRKGEAAKARDLELEAESLAMKAYEEARDADMSATERGMVERLLAEMKKSADRGNTFAKDTLAGIESARAIAKKRNALLRATGKSPEEIDKFLENTFLDGEEAKEIARGVVKGEILEEKAIAELADFIETAVGSSPPQPGERLAESPFELKAEEPRRPEPKTGKLFEEKPTAPTRAELKPGEVFTDPDFQRAAARAKSLAEEGWEVEYGPSAEGERHYVKLKAKKEPGSGEAVYRGGKPPEFGKKPAEPRQAALDLETEQGKLPAPPEPPRPAELKETLPAEKPRGKKPKKPAPEAAEPSPAPPPPEPPTKAPEPVADETLRAIGEKLQRGKELKPEEWAYLEAHGLGERMKPPEAKAETEAEATEVPSPTPEPAGLPKGKLNLVRVSLTDPTGEINVFELPAENATKILPRLRKLVGDAVAVGKPFVGRWKNYVSPAEAERDVLDFAREIKDTPADKWKEWNARPVEAVVENVIAGREADKPSKESIGIVAPGFAQAVAPPKPSYKFPEPAMEESYRRAHGVNKAPVAERIRAAARDVIHKITRTYEDLPNTAEFAKVKNLLKVLEKQKGVASDKAVRAIDAILSPLDKEQGNIFFRKVLLDDLDRMADEGKDLPRGFTPEGIDKALDELDTIIKGDKNLQDALAARKMIWDSLRKNYVAAMKLIGKDMDRRFMNPDYFRHQVLEYASGRGVFGPGARMRGVERRSFLHKRSGEYSGDINTKYVQAEFEVLAQMFHDIEVAKTKAGIRDAYDIMPRLQEEAKAINDGLKELLEAGRITAAEYNSRLVDWEKLMPEGYEPIAMEELETHFKTYGIPEKMAKALLEGAEEEISITADDLRRIIARGQNRPPWVVKTEVAKTLRKVEKPVEKGEFARIVEAAQRGWKRWVLTAPHKVFKYNVRNLTGDADKSFVGNPTGFGKVPRALREVWGLFYKKKPMSPELREWFGRGGIESLLQVQELPELNRFSQFERFEDQTLGQRIASIWRRAAGQPKKFTNAREAVLRYANFLSYLEQMKVDPNGRPRNFGASNPDEIMALDNLYDRAFRLSNELLGAYDEISVGGQMLRKRVMPFWSWNEANFKSYVRIFRNLSYDNTAARTMGNRVLAGVRHTPFMALKAGRLAIRAMGLVAATSAWNNLVHRDEEKDLPPEVKDTVHIILGRDKDGKVGYFNRLGALQDFSEWFGMDAGWRHLNDLFQGKKTVREVAVEMAMGGPNKLAQAVSPFIKVPFELISRKAFFPDIRNPRLIRDQWRHISSIWGLEDVYDKVFDRPSQPVGSGLIPKIFYYKSDPLEAAYHEVADMKADWLKKYGKGGPVGSLNPRSQALYNMRLAHRYGDKEQEDRYFREYLTYQAIEGGDLGKSKEEVLESVRKGLRATFKNMHPLAGLSKAERPVFIKTLDEDEKALLGRALRYYVEVLVGGNAELAGDEAAEEEKQP